MSGTYVNTENNEEQENYAESIHKSITIEIKGGETEDDATTVKIITKK